MHSRTPYVEVSQLNKFANSFGPELSWAEMITERSDPETKTLFMLLANIAQSELANQIPTVTNNMAAAIARKNHAVSLSSVRFLP